MRRFVLQRDVDETGVSGTGEVADGVMFDVPASFQFPDGVRLHLPAGWVRMKWRGERSSTGLWRDLETMLAVHGHNGATRVVWADLRPEGYFVDVDRSGE
jgi:hypothetical protein